MENQENSVTDQSTSTLDSQMPTGSASTYEEIPRLENPYSVSNMKLALESLINQATSGKATNDLASVNIEPTHYYVRFNPTNEEEYDALKSVEGLLLFQFPLDIAVADIPMALALNKKNAEMEKPSPEWCSVLVSRNLSNIGCPYTILEDLYIPDETKVNTATGEVISSPLPHGEALANESLKLTGNAETTPSTSKQSRWRPGGTIKTYDTYFKDFIPLLGVEVRARRFFTVHTGETDAEGNFLVNGLFGANTSAHYLIDWELYQFAIQDGYLSGANLLSKDTFKNENWIKNIGTAEAGTIQNYYATIFRAAYQYYYGDIDGLARPPQNKVLRTQMKIRAYDEYSNGALGIHNASVRFLGSQVKIYTNTTSNTIYKNLRANFSRTPNTYRVVIHELAHAAHWNLIGRSTSEFGDIHEIVKESWARGVDRYLTEKIYTNFTNDEWNAFDYRKQYAGITNDLIKPPGETTSYAYYNAMLESLIIKTESYDNKTSSYLITDLEDALIDPTVLTWNGWYTKIFNNINNETKNNVREAFDFWNCSTECSTN